MSLYSSTLQFVIVGHIFLPRGLATVPRIVDTKYGRIRGSVRSLGSLLGDVDVFLGIPYASAPVEEGRFTPTNSHTPWKGIRDATHPPPVCPQLLPDLRDLDPQNPRDAYIRSVIPALQNQSEDCLTLSIYSSVKGMLHLFRNFNYLICIFIILTKNVL